MPEFEVDTLIIVGDIEEEEGNENNEFNLETRDSAGRKTNNLKS